jgi:hypothetical protein
MNARTTTLATLALLALAGAPALAQSAPARGQGGATTGRFSKPLTSTYGVQPPGHAQGGVSTSVRMMMSKEEDGKTYELTVKGDEISAKVDGKEIPKDRIRRTGDSVEILDKDGDVATTFTVGAMHGGQWTSPGNLRLFTAPGGNTLAFGGQVDHPRVMIGVTMVEPGENLAEQLDLEPGTGVLLDSVRDDLPADKAGLKKGDVIVSFDGVKPITVAKAREILAKKKAGDKVAVVALRKGDEKKFTIELQQFDPSKLGQSTGGGWGAGGAPDMTEMHKQLEEAMKQGQAFRLGQGGNGFVFGGPGTTPDKWEVFSSPGSPEMKERIAALDKKLSELDEKMSKLDDQLSRLEKKLDKLNDHR